MNDYIDLLVAAGWIDPDPCEYCKNTRKGRIVHPDPNNATVTVDCWECTDPHSVQKHVDSCRICVQPYKRRRPGFKNPPGYLSPAIPPNYKPIQSPPNSIERRPKG